MPLKQFAITKLLYTCDTTCYYLFVKILFLHSPHNILQALSFQQLTVGLGP